jgi:hypothetical protein
MSPMEFGAFFILVILVVIVAAIGAILYSLGWIGQKGKLHPADGLPGDESSPEDESRPEHRRVSNEQHTEFVKDR